MLRQMIRRTAEIRARSVSLGNPRDPGLIQLFGLGHSTTAGVTVNEETAPNLAAVYCAVRCISETTAALPLQVFQLDGQDRDERPGHPVSRVWRRPNRNMTEFQFRSSMVAFCLLWGNAYAEILRNSLGSPTELWPIHPARVTPERARDGSLSYRIAKSTDDPRHFPDVIPADRMFHVPSGLGGSCEVGISVIANARESLGLGIAAERTGAGLFGNGARPGGVLTLSRPATRERKMEIADDWERNFGGPDKQSKIAVLDHESTYQKIGIDPNDAQFLETREFQIQEVARWFRLSPTKLMDFSRATFANIEEINRQFADESIKPWAMRFEQEAHRKLFTEPQQRRFAIKHNIRELYQGDIATMGEFWARARELGLLNINEIRYEMGRNSIGPDGDVYLQPLNLGVVGEEQDDEPPVEPATDLPPAESPEPPPADDEARRAIEAIEQRLEEIERQAQRQRAEERQRIARDILGRFLAKESAEARHNATPRNFVGWLERYYRRHEDKLAAALDAGGFDGRAAARQWCVESKRALLRSAECQPEHLAGRVAEVLETWNQRPTNAAKEICNGH